MEQALNGSEPTVEGQEPQNTVSNRPENTEKGNTPPTTDNAAEQKETVPAFDHLSLMPPLGEIVVPPLGRLTMMLFGEPKNGKTTFVAGNTGTFIYGTEPGQEFVRARKVYASMELVKAKGLTYQWELFQMFVREIWAKSKSGTLAKEGTTNIAIDIVDNLYTHCLTYICQKKGIEYPPESDWGKTRNEIRVEWETWLRRLMDKVNVTYITHCTSQVVEYQQPNGMTKEVTRWQPTFKGNKCAQYLDGIVNAIGHVRKSVDGKYMISFKGSPTTAAGDRTGILELLGDIPLNWKTVSAAYEAKATELGLKISR